ncbi:K02A2.6-like [Cordylochernes scorpioides]|uniref:RNA-directed DNA polymerase n=1 Tax=Cordylochernes scorpioides TaxID=51811 RepID=A0ABY6KZA9_9ARAC|nr:K02A2.6-like [Cordylochernes scorpioides]
MDRKKVCKKSSAKKKMMSIELKREISTNGGLGLALGFYPEARCRKAQMENCGNPITHPLPRLPSTFHIGFTTETVKVDRMTEDSNMQRMTEAEDEYFADALTNMQPHCDDLVSRLTDAIRGLAMPRAEEALIPPFDGSYAANNFIQQLERTSERPQDDATMQARLRALLKGEPLSLYNKLNLASLPYSQAKQTLIDLYPGKSEVTFTKFLTFKLTNQIQLGEYYRQKITMGLQLGLTNPIIVEALTEGLQANDQRLMRAIAPKTLTEWYSTMTRIKGTSSLPTPSEPFQGVNNTSAFHRDTGTPSRGRNYNPFSTNNTPRYPSGARRPPSPCKYCQGDHWNKECSMNRLPYRQQAYHSQPTAHYFPPEQNGAHNLPVPAPRTNSDKIIALRPYRISLSDQREIQEQVGKMLEYDIIEPSFSPYSSPITLVTKKDKTKRFCVDYRRLNEIIFPDVHPLPLIENILDKLANAKIYSRADFSLAYWSIEISPPDRNLLSFVTLEGQYNFKRLPYGIKIGPQVYERAVSQILQRNRLGFIAHYFDHFIIFSNSIEEHLDHLQQFFDMCNRENFRLNYNKCDFFKTTIEFLGYTISSGTYTPLVKNLDVINAIKVPTSVKSLQTFLGSINVYNKFIKDHARIRNPLNNLLKKDTPWHWDAKCQHSFDTLKECLTTKPVLHLFKEGLPCQLFCDASLQGIAGFLKQQHPDGTLHPVQYYSRAIRPHEKNYTITELECLAVIDSVEKFRIYLAGVRFTIFTDHHALQWLKTIKKTQRCGRPKRLLSDRAPAFTSPKFRRFLIKNGIQPLLTTANNPQANGLCERLNATLTGKLRLLNLENPGTSWTKLIKIVTNKYNDTPHTITGFPPVFLMYNIIPSDLNNHINPYPNIIESRKLAIQRTNDRHDKEKIKYDNKHKDPHFDTGDLVLVKAYHHPNSETEISSQIFKIINLWRTTDPIKIEVQINDKILSLEYDTGSAYSLISESTRRARLLVDPEVKPRFFKSRPIPYALKEKISRELDRLVKAGILKPVRHAEWAAPIVPVLKSDQTIRICGDFKITANQALKVDQYPLHKAEDIFAALAGGEKFSKIDLRDAYNQLELDDESQLYTVINTLQGLYKYTRLPFGISSAPALFQKQMDILLKGIPMVFCALDDILITGKNDQDHLKNLECALVLCYPKYKGTMIYVQWHLHLVHSLQRRKKYSQLEREALGIVFGVTRFRNYLLGNSFTLRTDHKPLVTLFSENKGIPTIAANRIQRWAIILSAYQYKIEYIKGTSNTEADVLSRLPMFTPEPDSKEPDSEPVEMVLLMDALDSSPVTSDDIRASLPGDPALRQALDHTLQGWSEETPKEMELMSYWSRRYELGACEGLLFWGNRVIIPTNLRAKMLDELHNSHQGIVGLKSVARTLFWWPGLDKDIEEDLNWPPTNQPWDRVHIDHLGPFEQNLYLIVVDACTKWIEAIPVPNTSTRETIEQLRCLFARFGIPRTLVSDNGTGFTSEEFRQFMTRNGIRHLRTAPFHPSSNGLAENIGTKCGDLTFLTREVKLRRPCRSLRA